MRNSGHKKSRRRLTAPTDRISDLPDSMIEHILSFLDAKDAVKTCILSKRWESSWTSIPTLIFVCEYSNEEVIHMFASFVDKTLMKHTCSNTQKFLLHLDFDAIPANQINSWLQFAINHKVDELCLQHQSWYEMETHNLPQVIYNNSSVTKMNLTSFHLDVHLGGIGWTSLKILCLTEIMLENNTVIAVLQGSPSMECLTLQKCYDDLGRIDASSTSLKELIIDNIYNLRGLPIDIIAPNLLSLSTVGFSNQPNFNLVDISSLLEANMDISIGMLPYSREKKMIKNFVQKLGHVNKLTLTIWCFQSRAKKAICARFPPATRKILTVDIKSTIGYLPGLSALLFSLPELEQLTINLMPSDYHKDEHFHFNPMEFFRNKKYLRQPLRRSLIRHLESVEIDGFVVGSCSNSDNVLFELVEYLLDNANVLQKLIIHARADSSTSPTAETFGKLYEITQKLMSYPRASSDIIVLFKIHLQ